MNLKPKRKVITLEEIQNFKGKYPKQLWYLALVEMWERFTFYGMRALLVLYISHLALSANYQPAAPAVIEQQRIEYEQAGHTFDESHPTYYLDTSLTSAKSDVESSSNLRYGLILAFIYAMAFVGGLFADKLFGSRHSVFWGGLLMALGTFAMAVPGEFSFYLGVSVLIVGNGFFKPNISTMVGDLYKDGDHRKDAGFSIFYMAINLGSLLSGATIAWVGTTISWSLAFALSGVCMLLGLGLFLFTQHKLGPIGLAPDAAKLKVKKFGITKNIWWHLASLAFIPFFLILVYKPIEVDLWGLLAEPIAFSHIFMGIIGVGILGYLGYLLTTVSKAEFGKLLVAMILIIFSVIFWSFYEQGGGSMNFFARDHVDGLGLNMTSINNMINPLWVIILAFPMSLLWLWLGKKKKEPNVVVKFGMGFLFLGIAFLIFYSSRFFMDDQAMVPLMSFISAYGVLTIGELCLSPIGLSMITTLTPHRLHGVMMGTWFLASAYGQYGAGVIGSILAKVTNLMEGVEPTKLDKLMTYTDGFQNIGIIGVVSAIILLAASPLLVRIMNKK